MFEVGDTVRVKKDADGIRNEYIPFINGMKEYLDNVYVIKKVKDYQAFKGYTLEGAEIYGNPWLFAEEWLEHVEDIKIDIKESDLQELLCLK